MKRIIDIQNQLLTFRKKQKDIENSLEAAEAVNDNSEMLILEMQLSEIKGIIKALSWVLN